MPSTITREIARAEGWYQPNERGGVCYCGCGGTTPVAPQGDRRRGWIAGEHVRYLRGHAIRVDGQAARMHRLSAKPPRDLTGKTFGAWTAVRYLVESHRGYWECFCECSPEVLRRVEAYMLATGGSRSCGCRRYELTAAANTRHGRAGDRLYKRWSSMIQRCTNPQNARYKDYGGRGIRVCERWFDFANFAADMGDPPSGLSIDRIDNDGNYEPGNCRWATLSEQRRNQRRP